MYRLAHAKNSLEVTITKMEGEGEWMSQLRTKVAERKRGGQSNEERGKGRGEG